ncbi:carboxypeptidase regulatory-like domain-containing protein [Streptomyces sp. CRCS-T-1]|uniref:Carboxypeptidase regulatory-like domain-containing protein n=1 Tax=Streptomyces koelreuteriae TaxID=2838015 RepID=A0ABX8FT12_9ACTN|nr:carboxypeptidase regulatory-like domain-containing protein [Streptomyces sp. CRCS-T-1]QWB24336.1 carboxypeptidase regulatory-like domain-containing protein [Streptomyces koelreuteriae]UUA07339.1 carboxypeptidase regulatory-like domain-containing protein [Streptomyces koelreuteriae]UUA14968.1 carboxypeptidase regulatory-like domain-containing protein [Streptomyces sp. CRCS-T-1]
MNRYSRAAAVAGVVGVVGVLLGAGASVGAEGGGVWGAAVIAPGREGIVEVVAGYPGAGAGATLTLTAPRGARVTGTPLDASGYRGSVAADGRSGAYTVTREAVGRTFPFVLAVPAGAVPGTRLRGCELRITDARGVRRASGRCAVTVGLAGPTLTRPLSGVPLHARPEISGHAHPGAQVTVRDKDEREACATTAARDGTWACTPAPALPAGANRLQAVATLNGVSAMSEQIDIAVTGDGRVMAAGAGQ